MIRRSLAFGLLAALAAAAHAQTPGPPSSPDGRPQVGALSFGPLTLVKLDAVYPEEARAARISGWVAFRFHLTPDGLVQNPAVVAAVERDHFSQASLNALMRWQFAKVPEDAAAEKRLGCALFLFQHPTSPLDVATLAEKIGTKFDCGRATATRQLPGGAFQ